jgi:NAD+ synthase
MIMETKPIKLPSMDPEQVSKEIGDFIAENVTKFNLEGAVIGLSGGVDSTTSAALTKRAFDKFNDLYEGPLELVGYVLPSSVNNPKDADDGIMVAQRLGIEFEVVPIHPIVEACKVTNPEAFEDYHKGNMMSRIRANILHTKAACGNKLVMGTGNKDEDFGIGYYTLFGDGAVHLSPIGNLSKRLVREMATYLGFEDLSNRVPTAGLEPGQTDFSDLGYGYDVVELVTEGLSQGFDVSEIIEHPQVTDMVKSQLERSKHNSVKEVVEDVYRRHKNQAGPKAELVCPKIAKVTLKYE